MTKILAFNFIIALSGVFVTGASAAEDETSCPPRHSKLECQKIVAERFKECAKTATLNGSVNNEEGLSVCKEFAKQRNEECKNTCHE